MRSRSFHGAAIGISFFASAPTAWACLPAEPNGVYGTVYGNTVALSLSDGASCPVPGGVLRQNVATGDVVRLPDVCGSGSQPDGGDAAAVDGGADASPPWMAFPGYLDECVPPGEYRYGRSEPVSCESNGARYFTTVIVTEPLPSACARTRTAEEPRPVAGAPWRDDPWICEPAGDPCRDSQCNVGAVSPPGSPPSFVALLVAGFCHAAWCFRRRR